MEKKILVTIGREYGSGGRTLGKALAEALGIAYYDKELITETARESGMDEEILKEFDEKNNNFLFSYSVGGDYTNDLPLDSKVFLAQFETIKKIADRQSALFVGRCSDYILREYPDCISVFVYADKEARIQKVMERDGMARKEAEKHMDKIDKKRMNYYEYYTGRDWRDMHNYDICIKTSEIDTESAVALIETVMRCKGVID
jgi:cytidylate kinase